MSGFAQTVTINTASLPIHHSIKYFTFIVAKFYTVQYVDLFYTVHFEML